MARGTYEKTPEELARDQMRYNATLQTAQHRQDLVNARISHRNYAVKYGVPKSVVPDVSQIRNMDDASWNEAAGRMSRYGFHGVDEQGRLISAPGTVAAPAPKNSGLAPGATETAAAAGYHTNPVPNVTPNVTASPMLNQFSTTPGDARNIAARYGGQDQAGPARQHTYLDAKGKDLGPMYDADGVIIPMPKGTTGIRGGGPHVTPPSPVPTPAPVSPLNQLANAPTPLPAADFNTAAVPPRNSVDLTQPGPVFQTEPAVPTAPTLAQRIGTGFRQGAVQGANALADTFLTKPLGALTSAANAVVGAVRPPLNAALNSVSDFARGAFNPAGATTASASQFQKPTQANPNPVTPTSPVKDVDTSDSSIAKFGATEEELRNRKLAFAGF